ncbi:MAG: glycine betaine ABC transporter substrate-binding protein [Ancrocorticia populi]|uniref:glycine betaine ABC transporter substrate-binding protein n=1 Tax=Ancrocorticia populi TaxID=2175228 RepID=UPI003F9218FF
MRKKNPVSPAKVASVLAVGALVLSGCGGDGGDDKGSITIGAVPGWSDQTGTAYLYKSVLEEAGYDVEIQELGDNALVYSGVFQGQIDLFGSGWIDRTHESYWEEYSDSLEDLGTYYDDARLFLAVPEYSDIESIEDLPEHASDLENQIIGIEPGAGLTMITEDEVIPHYGLDTDFEFVQSSTAAMISELESALKNEKDIVVTLWTPFWATVNYDVRELEDPDGIYGEPEALHTLGREGFSEDYPEVVDMIENFELTGEQYGDLEDTMINEYGGNDDEAAVEAWLEENPEFRDELVEALS